MTEHDDIERVIASMASGEPIDWDAARAQAMTGDERARIEALRGIEQIAAFSHVHWEEADRQDDALPGRRDPAASLAGRVLGAYTLESPIGEGGMGSVWLARRSDGRFEGRAAVKLLHLPRVGRAGLARFEREGQILARLRHAHIAQLLDAGVAPDGQPYLVLEYVDGVALDRFCDRHASSVRDRIELFLQVLGAVAHAHANLVLHRDLKPSNILVDGAGQVKLLDFGIAKLLEFEGVAAVETELTQHAGHAFTPEFAAPEQLRGEPVTTATDVYAAGVVLYRLLTGQHPTAGVRGSPVERIEAILETAPKPASLAVATGGDAGGGAAARRQRELEGDLDNILAKALKKAPEERYANAAAFADDLRRYLHQEPVTARADTISYRVGKFVRRHRAAVVSATAGVLALLAVALIAIMQLFEARRQRDQAQAQTQRAEAFNTVITSLLSQVGPDGRALAPEELLDRAVDEMQARYAGDLPFLVDMLIRISGRYLDLRKHEKELATLVKAEEFARQSGDTKLIFRVQVNTVETELALGRKAEARRRIDEARALLPAVEPLPKPHEYLRAEAEVAKAEGDVPRAIEYLEQGRRALEADDDTHGNGYHGMLSMLRLYYSLAGDTRTAHDYAQRMVESNRQHDREQSASGTTANAVLAVSVYSCGEVERARSLFEAAIPEFKRWSPGTPTSWISLAWLYGEILSRAGLHETAVALTEESVAAVRKGGNRMNLIRARLTSTRALLRAGRAGDAQHVLDAAVADMKIDEAANRVWLIEAARLQSEIHLAHGQLDAALREAHTALERIGYPQKPRGFALPQTLLTLAQVQSARNEPARAMEAARAAVRIFEQDALDPSRSADVGEALLEQARAERSGGDARAAAATLARALPALRQGLGAEHALAKQSEAFAVGLR
jgi:serine/threonine-protein kinase